MSETKTEKAHRALAIRTASGISLKTLRKVLVDSDLDWVYAERMADTGLGTVADLLNGEPLGAPKDSSRPGVRLEQWEHGRAFGPELEIDWWREGEAFRLRALSEGDVPDSVNWTEPGDGPVPVAVDGLRPMVLHGSYDDKSPPERPTWSEARIPRHLAYPIQFEDSSPSRRVVLLGQDYVRGDVVVLTRLVKVVPFDKSKTQLEGEIT